MNVEINNKKHDFSDEVIKDLEICKEIEKLKEEKKCLQDKIEQINNRIDRLNRRLSVNNKIYEVQGEPK